MLLILYGALAKMGKNCRDYLENAGYAPVDKYNFAVDPVLTTEQDQRKYVSQEVFLENTDSLFRYEVGGIRVGFNHKQISDAVCGKTNRLLSLSTGDIGFLAEIKRVYGDQVCIIYTYIDDTTLKNIIESRVHITQREAETRIQTGLEIKRSYLEYRHIFDHVVMYGGEGTVFDCESLYRQFDSIIGKNTEEAICCADVFVSYSVKDRGIYESIRDSLQEKGITVFDDAQLSMRTDWSDAVSAAIRNAKVVMPVLTESVLKNPMIKHEIEFALKCAENNGTLIIPVVERGVDVDNEPLLKTTLCTTQWFMVHRWAAEEEIRHLAERVSTLLCSELQLKEYSKQVENYLCLKMYEQARDWQQKHLELCKEVCAASYSTFLDAEACLLSQSKLINILLDMQQYREALETAVDALNNGQSSAAYNMLADQFMLCCANLGMRAEEVRALIQERLSGTEAETMLAQYDNALSIAEANRSKETEGEIARDADEENKIAQYGELAIALFEELIKTPSGTLGRNDLILGYERILNYCKYVGLKGDVAEKCISRIAQLSAAEDPEKPEKSLSTEALKIYLGQAVPMSGEYDAFVSFKSEDEVLARKVYDYLVQSGKEVFFAKETLPWLGESDYEDMIYEAMDRSRHMVLVSSNPDYLKTSWVKAEWGCFNNEIREGRKDGNIVLLLTDDIAADKGRLPGQLRQKEIIKMSEFRNRLLSYVR